MKICTNEDLLQAVLDYNVPLEIFVDVVHRMLSWIESGGYMSDNYIRQQYRYIENYININLK